MTALVGYCFEDGAFLVADTQRIVKYPKTDDYWAHFEVSKIYKLNENIGFATCGNPIDEARLALQVKTKLESTKDEITKFAIRIFGDLLVQVPSANTNLVIFGHENGVGFIRHLEWKDSEKKFSTTDYAPNKIFADGFIPEGFYKVAEARFKESFAPMIKGTQLDLWAEMIMGDIVNATEKAASIHGANPVGFPIDLLMFRVDNPPAYIRRFMVRNNLKDLVKFKIVDDVFTVRM